MKKLLPLLLLLVAGCPSAALQSSITPLWAQRQYTLNTEAKCISDQAFLNCAERIYQALASEAIAQGYAKSLDELNFKLGKPGICLIPSPEPCKSYGGCAAGSSGQDCTPKAGCTTLAWSTGSLWISQTWSNTAYNYTATLEDEMKHLFAGVLGIYNVANHSDAWSHVRTGMQCP